MDIGVTFILVITLSLFYKRASFTKPYPALCIPGSFLNLYIKQKVGVIGSMFPIILEEGLFIPFVSCTNFLSHSPYHIPFTSPQALHWVTTQKYNCKAPGFRPKHCLRLHPVRCCGAWQKPLYASLWMCREKALPLHKTTHPALSRMVEEQNTPALWQSLPLPAA